LQKTLLRTPVVVTCILLVAAATITTALLAIAANAEVVKVGNLVLRANGSFTPHVLPRDAFAPIDFQGYAEIEARKGATPPALQTAVIDFDRDGRLNTGGLASCSVEQVRNATPEQARRICPKAIVGTGRITGLITLPGEPPRPEGSALTIFNGPRQNGAATAILHAQTPPPVVQTFAISVPIERRRGAYGYRATIEVPPIADGLGVLTRVSAKIGRRYVFAGKKRSYVSARCRDGLLQAHGHFSFADGTIIDGSVYRPCNAR
jgi:hypothetical protein